MFRYPKCLGTKVFKYLKCLGSRGSGSRVKGLGSRGLGSRVKRSCFEGFMF